MLQFEKNDIKLSLVVAAIVLGVFLANLGLLIETSIGIEQPVFSNLSKGMILITLLACWKVFLTRFNVFLLKFVFYATFLIIFNELFFGDNEYFPRTLSTFITLVLPSVLTFSVIKDFIRLFVILRKTALVISGLLLVAILSGSTSTFDSSYAMGFAGAMILPTVVLIDQLLEGPTTYKMYVLLCVAIVLNMLSVIVYGSRGAFLAIVAFLFYCLVRQLQTRYSGLVFLVFAFCCLFILIFHRLFLEFVLDYLVSQGYRSRTLFLFLNDITHDSGRMFLWWRLLDEVLDNPFAIRGIDADYLLNGTYSHNFFLELVYEFGILIGGLCSIYIIWNMVETLRKDIKDGKSKLEIFLLFSFFPVCLWSGSIWISMYFWSWFAVKHTNKNNLVLIK